VVVISDISQHRQSIGNRKIDDEQSVRDSATAAIACLLASLQRRGACEAANYSATLRSVN